MGKQYTMLSFLTTSVTVLTFELNPGPWSMTAPMVKDRTHGQWPNPVVNDQATLFCPLIWLSIV